MRSNRFFTFFVCSSLIAGTAFAQQRHCDLQVTLLSPAEGEIIQPFAHFDIKIKIQNLGPDDMAATDTIFYNTPMVPLTSYIPFVLGQAIPAGQSADILLENVPNVNENPSDEVLSFCVKVIDNPANEGLFTDTVTDNNYDCNNITLRSATTGIAGVSEKNDFFSVYPNPAMDKLFISFTDQLAKEIQLQLLDMSGRTLKSMQLAPAAEPASVHIGNLVPGIYFIECQAGGQRAFRKFIKH